MASWRISHELLVSGPTADRASTPRDTDEPDSPAGLPPRTRSHGELNAPKQSSPWLCPGRKTERRSGSGPRVFLSFRSRAVLRQVVVFRRLLPWHRGAAFATVRSTEVNGFLTPRANPQTGLKLDRGWRRHVGGEQTNVRSGSRDWERSRRTTGSSWCRAAHFSSWARSWSSSSSVRASESFSPDFLARVAFERACASVGTGTTRPQSGHLPATGRSTIGDLQPTAAGAKESQETIACPGPSVLRRRSRICAPHLGHSIRSGPSDGIFSFSPHRQVTRGMTRAWWLVASRGLRVSGQERLIRSCQQRTTKCWALAACHDRLPEEGSPPG